VGMRRGTDRQTHRHQVPLYLGTCLSEESGAILRYACWLAEAVYMVNEDECIDASEELNVGATLTTVDVQAILTTQLR